PRESRSHWPPMALKPPMRIAWLTRGSVCMRHRPSKGTWTRSVIGQEREVALMDAQRPVGGRPGGDIERDRRRGLRRCRATGRGASNRRVGDMLVAQGGVGCRGLRRFARRRAVYLRELIRVPATNPLLSTIHRIKH